jgi:hypothetical protein
VEVDMQIGSLTNEICTLHSNIQNVMEHEGYELRGIHYRLPETLEGLLGELELVLEYLEQE